MGQINLCARRAAPQSRRPGMRINCVSPTVVVESPDFQRYFSGFQPVPVAEVAFAYLRAISNLRGGF
jgi:hypothetical protein